MLMTNIDLGNQVSIQNVFETISLHFEFFHFQFFLFRIILFQHCIRFVDFPCHFPFALTNSLFFINGYLSFC